MSFVKGFLISFVISFLVFAVIILYGGSFALTLIDENDKSESEENVQGGGSDDVQNTVTYASHERFSFALVITDEIEAVEDTENTENEDTEEPDDTPAYKDEFDSLLGEFDKKCDLEIKYIGVVSINATVKKSFITVIPGDSITSVGGVDMSLNEAIANRSLLFPKSGTDAFIKSTVVAFTGINADFVGYVDINDYVKLASELKDVKYKLTSDIRTRDPETGKRVVLLRAGELTLTSENLLTMLTYGGSETRYFDSQILIDTGKNMLSAICDKFRPNIIAKAREMLEYVTTDFTTTDMSKISNILFSFKDSEKTGTALLGAYEKFEDMGYLFRVNINGSVNKFKQYLG